MSLLSNVKETPEFASLCSYIQLFGQDLNVSFSHAQLATYLEIKNIESAPKQWIDIHRKLLKNIKVKCANDKWESSLKKFVNTILLAEETLPDLYNKDYFSISSQLRARLLNIIFDFQFDKNIKFKEKVNQKQDKELRVKPFGSDIYGCLYWLFVDPEVDIILYKENLEEESFKVIAQSVDEMRTLLDDLTTIDSENAPLSKLYIESITPEDTNSPNNELDVTKCEDIELCDIKDVSNTILKVEELREINQSERNGNSSPIKLEDLIINDESLRPEESKPDISASKDTESEDKVAASKIEPEESTLEREPESVDDCGLFGEELSLDLKINEKKKRGRKPKLAEIVPIAATDLDLCLRRSERKRKPVNPFSIAYVSPSPKKGKIVDSQNDNTDLAESESNKRVNKKTKEINKEVKTKNKEHSKRGRPKKLKKHTNKESKVERKSKKKSKHKVKFHGKEKHKKPWEMAESSEEHVEEEEEVEEDIYQAEESEESMCTERVDGREDLPESDFDPENLSLSSDEETLKSRGRNYFRQKSRLIKAEQEDPVDDKPCQICLGSNLPEMILLCDECDLGHHAMCLKPSLMLIPEGDWFCPKCQHRRLVGHLADKIVELDKSLAKNSAKIRMQERLNFVNISMSNILASNRGPKKEKRSSNDESERRSPNDSSSPSYTSSSKTGDDDDSSDDGSSSAESGKRQHGRYKFRDSNRKENTRYNFEEMDKLFNSALENDEKYQIMKSRQEREKSNESEPEYDYSGIEPRKKSSGKDMSNILEEEKPQLRRPTKRKRLTYASDDDDFEDDAKDQDFKLSDQSGSDGYDEDEKLTADDDDDASDSDHLWVGRTRRSARKSHKRKETKKRRVERREERRDMTSRPKRNAARKVNYLEMLADADECEDGEEDQKSPDYESSDVNDSSKPPPVLARNKSKKTIRRRKISDSEYEESKDNSASDSNNDSGSTERLQSIRRKKRSCLDSETDSQNDDGEKELIIVEKSVNMKEVNTEEENIKMNEDDDVNMKKNNTKSNEVSTNMKEDDTKTKEDDTKTIEDNIKTKENDNNVKEDDTKTKEDDTKTKEDDTRTKEDNIRTKEDSAKTMEDNTKTMEDNAKTMEDNVKTKEDSAKTMEDNTNVKEGIMKMNEEYGGTKDDVGTVESRSSLSSMNPMRAKANQDIDVENEVESESDSDTESPLKICVNPISRPEGDDPRSFSRH